MPNHLHWVITPAANSSVLAPIIQRFKSFTSHAANKILDRTGAFWSREYFDHRIQSDEEFAKCVRYTIHNPVKAKLCDSWKQWQWTCLSDQLRNALAEEDTDRTLGEGDTSSLTFCRQAAGVTSPGWRSGR